MKNKILLTLIFILSKQVIAKGQPITLFIPQATAQEIENKKYVVPNLKTGRDEFITKTNQASVSVPNINEATVTPQVAPVNFTNNYAAKKPKVYRTKLTARQEQALKISEAYNDGSAIPIAGEAGRTVFIYGQKQPTIICATFTVCMIELEKDEIILQQDSGDTVRWIITPSNGMPYISIKPIEENLQTNFIVITNKRQYTFKLQSTKNRYMSLVSFRYPETSQSAKEKWDSYYKLNNLNAKAQARKYENTNALNAKNIDYNYNYIGDAPFKPIRTWTDNIKTYIQLPKSIASGEMPIFNVLSKSKSIKLVNQRYDYEKQIIEVDYKVEHGVLQLGKGKDLQIVEIIHSNNTQQNFKFLSER